MGFDEFNGGWKKELIYRKMKWESMRELKGVRAKKQVSKNKVKKRESEYHQTK